MWVMWCKYMYGYIGKAFFKSLSRLTGVQTINYIRVCVETSATVKALNTKEDSTSKNASHNDIFSQIIFSKVDINQEPL